MIRRCALAGLGLLCGFALALPVGFPPARAHDGSECRDQAALAEQRAGIPDGLLLAIGKQESGRPDSTTGVLLPWPYAVNRDGEGHLFAGLAEAVGFVAGSLRAGRTSVDVGCFQINLKYHPEAFDSLEQAFDPAANAAYAARFLRMLHDRHGSWDGAVANYHSATPAFGGPYRDAVLALWRGPASSTPSPGVHGAVSAVVATPFRLEAGVRIWAPSAAAPSFAALGGRRAGLPRVITPSVFR